MAKMAKMTGGSKDLVAERLEALKALIPAAFVDGRIDFDALKGELGAAVDSSKEHYRFVWNGKEEARAFAHAPSMGTLRPCEAESAGVDGAAGKFDSENLYIEGDNLEVLKLLQGAYHNAVKMIYIDPPYNTGHDFVYSDNFTNSIQNYKQLTGQSDEAGNATHANAETSGRYHTDWLNMMFPRLLLARNLLREDGVIFVSIDDNEVTNMRKLCDEVFGETNFVAELVWTNKEGGGGSDSSLYKVKHEYVLVYARDISKLVFNGELCTEDESYNYSDTHINERGKYKLIKLNSFSIQYSSSLDYPILLPNGETVFPSENGKRGCWRWSREKFEWGVANDYIEFKQNQDGKLWVYTKQYFKVDNCGRLITRTLPPQALIDKYSSTMASKQVEELFDRADLFDYSKPMPLIRELVYTAKCDDSIVLDFFSGSATTAHAVMQLNAEDGGKRKFIMVQLPEPCKDGSAAAEAGYKNICEIGKARICKAGAKIRAEMEKKREKVNEELDLSVEDPQQKTLPDVGFKVFKLDTSNVIPWNPNPEKLEAQLESIANNILPERTIDDLIYEILLKCNVPLTLPVEKRKFHKNTIVVVGNGALMMCLDTRGITAAVAEEMVRLRDEEYKYAGEMQVVFRDTGFTDKEKANALATLVQNGVDARAILSF